MKAFLRGTLLVSFFFTSASAIANDRVCVNGEDMRINNVQFMGHVSNIYKSFGKPIRTSKWFYTDGNYYVTDLIYPGVTFTVTDESSGYDRIQKVVITKPNIRLPNGAIILSEGMCWKGIFVSMRLLAMGMIPFFWQSL